MNNFELKEIHSVEALHQIFKVGNSMILICRASQTPEESKPKVPIPKISWIEKNQDFAWSFARSKDGTEIAELKSFIETLKNGPLEESGFRYSLSKDCKFLQLIKLDKK